MAQRDFIGVSSEFEFNRLRDLSRLISLLSIHNARKTWKGKQQKYYPAIEEEFSKSKYSNRLPAEEDFCRALNTLEGWGLYLTASESKMTEAQKKEMAEVIYRELPSDSFWIKDAFGYLADVMNKAGYTFSKKDI